MRWLLPITTILTLIVLPALRAQEKPIDVPIGSDKYRLIGRLHEPFGTVLRLQGVVLDAKCKGANGPIIRIQRINDRATQEDIQIELAPGFQNDQKLTLDQTYELKGYETGAFVGLPQGAIDFGANKIGPPSPSFGFVTYFEFTRAERIPPIRLSPADFVDREALIEGVAISHERKAYIVSDGGRLLVDVSAPWPKGSEDKTVEGFGTIRKTDTAMTYRLENGVTRLVRLKDQLGREVALRGTAWSMNGHWWFNYRGTEMYVEGIEDLPGWNAYLHGEPVVITGHLEEAVLPRIDQITLKSDRDRKKYFIVRKPSWKPLNALLAPERVNR